MNITRAILELRIEYAKVYKLSPTDINCGLCMDFAAEITKQGFGDDIWGHHLQLGYWSNNIQTISLSYDMEYFMSLHCFIMYDGKFYDSETPQGCNYPDDLLCYQKNMDVIGTDEGEW